MIAPTSTADSGGMKAGEPSKAEQSQRRGHVTSSGVRPFYQKWSPAYGKVHLKFSQTAAKGGHRFFIDVRSHAHPASEAPVRPWFGLGFGV